MKSNRKNLIRYYIAFCLCLNADVIVQAIGGTSGRGNTLLASLLIYFLVACTILFITPIYKVAFSTLVQTRWPAMLYVWSGLSVFWAPDVRHVLGVLGSILPLFLCGLIASYYLSGSESIEIFRKTIVFLAAVSAIVQIIAPQQLSTARAVEVPGWTGIYGEKNHFGVGMAVGFLAVLASPAPWTFWKFLQLGLLTVLLFGSQSTTATGAAAIAALAYLFLLMKKRRRPLFLASLVGATILSFALVPHLTNRLFDVAGKNTNLTGRDKIWAFVIDHWKEKPILGYGTYSFWSEHEDEVLLEFGWNPSSAHNGFLELLVTTGVIGLGFLLAALGSGFFMIRRAFRTGNYIPARWLLLIWIALIVENITEADFMVPGPLWFCYCVAYFVTYAEIRRVAQSAANDGSHFLSDGSFDLEASFTSADGLTAGLVR